MDTSEWKVVQVCEGVEIVFDPAKFEALGIPMGFTLDTKHMKLTFDVKVHVVAGNQDSKIENILTLQSAR